VVIVHLETADRTWRNIEYYLTVGNKILRDFHARVMGIDYDVRGAIVIHYPVIECSK
jgi:hypothetical protein